MESSSVSFIEVEVEEVDVLKDLVRFDREVEEQLEELGPVALKFLKVLDLIIAAKSMPFIRSLSF